MIGRFCAIHRGLQIQTSLFFIPFLLLLTTSIGSQTTALDFEQADCDSGVHHLFSELDAGKVVILDFVMSNCAPCIVGTNEHKVFFKSIGYTRCQAPGFPESFPR